MKKIYLNTPLSSLSRREIVRIGRMAERWCRKWMGVNNRKAYYPAVYFNIWPDDPDVCGEYESEWNEIYIFYRNCTDVREFLATLIHEWQHQLQPLRTQYFKYKGPYYRNPCEVEARKAEGEYLRPLWEGIKGRVNRS